MSERLLHLVELYKKIKTNTASDDERIKFELEIEMSSFRRECVIQNLEEVLQKENKK